tara:strand:- start:254 stop:397 length:144 start_codon:yes stop_codon:yes gene_type:complete
MKEKASKHQKIQKKITKKLKKISKLQEEIYWLARKRDKLVSYTRRQN